MDMKNKITVDEDMLAEIFEGLEDCLENAANEPVAVMSENETFVVMTLEAFECLHNQAEQKPFISVFLQQLEDLSVEQLEHILALTNSQLTIKTAKEYFCGEDLA